MADSLSITRGRARYAALSRWAAEPDPSGATRAARDAFLAKFARQVDPDGRLSAEERTRRALIARRAYFQKMALDRMTAKEARLAQKSTARGDIPAVLEGSASAHRSV